MIISYNMKIFSVYMCALKCAFRYACRYVCMHVCMHVCMRASMWFARNEVIMYLNRY